MFPCMQLNSFKQHAKKESSHSHLITQHITEVSLTLNTNDFVGEMENE